MGLHVEQVSIKFPHLNPRWLKTKIGPTFHLDSDVVEDPSHAISLTTIHFLLDNRPYFPIDLLLS